MLRPAAVALEVCCSAQFFCSCFDKLLGMTLLVAELHENKGIESVRLGHFARETLCLCHGGMLPQSRGTTLLLG